MKHSGSWVFRSAQVAVLGVGLVAGSVRLLAMAGTLDRPSLGLPESVGARWRDQVMIVLRAPNARFLGGRFVNAMTTLRYGGDTAALNQFLAGLAGCPGIRLRIQFVRDLESAWVLQHNGWSDGREFSLQIGIGPDGIRLEELQLPVLVGDPAASRSQKRSPEEKESSGDGR